MVHGDLRDVNILLKNGDPSQLRLVDFDWADKIGEARYPKFLSTDVDLGRPNDVEAFEFIKPEYDLHMIQNL